VMTEAVLNEDLDLQNSAHQQSLIQRIMNEVMNNNLLKGVESEEEQTRLRTLLALFSLPRRFNLILMQDLVERFAPQYALKSSLAYMTLPAEINKVTSVLNWSLEHAGYYIATPVRNLFLLQYRIEQPHVYRAIHAFLAEKNDAFAHQVSGSDHIRYMREYFYHLSYAEENSHAVSPTPPEEYSQLQGQLTRYIEQLAQHGLMQSIENSLQFYEEFKQDEELQQALDKRYTSFALSLILKNFIGIYKQLPDGEKRENYLKDFFSLITEQKKNGDLAFILLEGMRHIIKQVSREDAIKLFNELFEDEKELKPLQGAQFAKVRDEIFRELVEEG